MDVRDYLFREKLPLMNTALEAYALRQRTIAKNIANATTPGYRPERVRFEEEFLESEMLLRGSRTDPQHVIIGPPLDSEVRPHREDAPVPRPEVYFAGESHVNVDKEMSELAKNQIRFRLVARLAQRYFNSLQQAIKGMPQ
ncbi:MAG: flagellar basal body rod protein FlgB [Bacteroidota bacterium]|nr:flagellar basal body rod protein FlgB [Candidatus Kapabacteria bacterium]MCS7302767.1 flagellar basal body rod protein FlgB [Candidatus Kapabacteria bacterium]MCX7937003.1 flagellar basal body rod protein FlgB [Chlorobiota bacterium]MDW8075474.1 flagellar basal body rod protein FlgB [Bacteroidota bacterium]MDW8272331.1 flagellar basal body rod protein FlgB [Bacteroidota bacterium]